jgi:hypothetical protein
MALEIFRLREAEMPWGDYGHILANGMAEGQGGPDEPLKLERTGPFVPPISFPGHSIVVTDTFRMALENSGLSGQSFLPIAKKRITRVDWRRWSPIGDDEMKYPSGNEPENYILRRKHSPETAEELGVLWQLWPAPIAEIDRTNGFKLVAESCKGKDFFQAANDWTRWNYVSRSAREWLEREAAEWVSFEPVAAC